jgi:glycosyltransferase involved in cell wall biosynthesis
VDDMKKLLFITWSISYGYGTEKSLADVLNRMDDTKYEISILPLFQYAESTFFDSRIQVLAPLVDYTAENFDEQEALKEYYRLLASPLQFYRRIPQTYDVIIACNHNAPSYFASYIKGGKKILWIRGDMQELNYHSYEKNSPQYRQIKQEHNMQAGVLKCFDAIVVISRVVRQALADLFGVTENVVQISNSVDSEKIKKLGETPISLPDKFLFTTLGRLDCNKNQMLLLKAAAEIRKERKDFLIYILGEGEERKKLEQYILENHLEENVQLPGFVENPYPYIKNSTATVLTSLSEGFSLVLAESVILNTPVISTDVGIARELVEKYDCGNVVGYEEKEISAVMLRYMNQYDGYPKKIFHIGDEYDIQTEVQKTEDLIDAVVEREDNNRMKRLPYPEVTMGEQELNTYEIQQDHPYVLRVIKDQVPYEYLIHRRNSVDKLIVFHNGAVVGGNVTVPVFQRHSWIKNLKTSAIFCMDPTLYLNPFLQIGWGVGKNENYYLKHSSEILGKIIKKMGIQPENTVIYGTSAGGYLSIMTGIYLKGVQVVADNAQLDVRDWMYQDAVDAVLDFCFDHVSDALKYPERFSVVQAFETYGYVPKLYLHVNLCSVADNSTQLVPFLQAAEKMKGIKDYHSVKIYLHYEPTKGHDGMGMEEALDFLYSILGLGIGAPY